MALLLSPLATALLTPVMKAIEHSPRAGRLIRARDVRDADPVIADTRTDCATEERGLAA